MRALPIFAILLLVSLAAAGMDSPWEDFRAPSEHSPLSVGNYTNGCLLGGHALPAEGEGYQVVRLSRHRYFGHPQMIGYLSDLGKQVEAAGLGVMLVADMAMPRGGPFDKGHRSHQTGLDADIWLRLDIPRLPAGQRDDLEAVEMVDEASFRIDPDHWTEAQAQLLYLAASDPRVARIFVHPAIKKALCDHAWPSRDWLRIVRPWYRHNSHFHVRLRCPTVDKACIPQEAPPEGDGCGAELASWYPENRHERPSPPPRERPPLPTVCQALLNDTTPR